MIKYEILVCFNNRNVCFHVFGSYKSKVPENLVFPKPCLAMAPYSSTLAWRIPWMEEPGGLQSMGSLTVGPDWATSLSLFTFMRWRRKWQPTPVCLPGESQGQGEPGGLPSMGSHRVGHDWATKLNWTEHQTPSSSLPHCSSWQPQVCSLSRESVSVL